MNYTKLLEESYEFCKSRDPEVSRLEFIGEMIFGFDTYEDTIMSKMAEKCLEVCCAVTDRTIFEYIQQEDGELWYLLMVNMPFFIGKLGWGCSIRGAWWDFHWDNKSTTTLSFCGMCIDGDHVNSVEMDEQQWDDFIRSLKEFAQS